MCVDEVAHKCGVGVLVDVDGRRRRGRRHDGKGKMLCLSLRGRAYK
jgi:hypothetical protein